MKISIAEMQAVKSAMSSLSGNISNMSSAIGGALDQEMAECNSEVTRSRQKMGQILEVVNKLKSDIQTLTAKSSQLFAEIQQIINNITSIEQVRIPNLIRQIDMLNTSATASNNQNPQASRQAYARIESLKSELRNAKLELNRLKTSLPVKKQQLVRVQEELKEKQRKLPEAERCLAEVSRIVKEMEGIYSNLPNSVQSCKDVAHAVQEYVMNRASNINTSCDNVITQIEAYERV